jgi:hypothetical protein
MSSLPIAFVQAMRQRVNALASQRPDEATLFNYISVLIGELIDRKNADKPETPTAGEVTEALNTVESLLAAKEANLEQKEGNHPTRYTDERQLLEQQKLVVRVARHVVTLVPALRFYADGNTDDGTTAQTALDTL